MRCLMSILQHGLILRQDQADIIHLLAVSKEIIHILQEQILIMMVIQDEKNQVLPIHLPEINTTTMVRTVRSNLLASEMEDLTGALN
jgi:hypothetical protein